MKDRSILDKLAQIEVVSWEWNERATAVGAKAGTRAIGVISQQVATVFPELAVEKAGVLHVDVAGLTAVVLAGVQELARRLDKLERAHAPKQRTAKPAAKRRRR